MREAMERGVTVNAKRDSTAPDAEFGIASGGEFGIPSGGEFGIGSGGDFGVGSVAKPDDYGRDFGIATSSPAGPGFKGADQGPCLYFGPRGQRCSRRALAGGFCAIHKPGGAPSGATGATSKPSKKFIASLLAIVAVIWPYLADIVREVIRWIHAH
jgi:hypothetical protein